LHRTMRVSLCATRGVLRRTILFVNSYVYDISPINTTIYVYLLGELLAILVASPDWNKN